MLTCLSEELEAVFRLVYQSYAKVGLQAPKAKGTTALMRAAMNRHDVVCKLLLAAGANVNTLAGNISALDIAQQRGHSDVAETLMAAGAD